MLGVLSGAAMPLAGGLAGAHVEITFNLLWLIPLFAVLMFTNMGLAFVIAGLMPNPGSGNQLSNGLGVPLMFLSGAMLPLSVPGVLPDIAEIAIPFASLIEAIRWRRPGRRPSITQCGMEVLIGVAWAVVTLALATRVYRFDQE